MTVLDNADLLRLKSLVEQAGYPAAVLPSGPENPLPHLLIGPGHFADPEGRPREQGVYIDLTFMNDALTALGHPVTAVDTLQCFVILPFQVPLAHQPDVAKLLTLLNILTPLGSFGVNSQGVPDLRYGLKVADRQAISAEMLKALLERLLFAMEHFAWRIELVATGQQTVEAIMDEVSQEFQLGDKRVRPSLEEGLYLRSR